tara:strand:- start:245 stop:382 length:138 start_codon:yes stop_codon:yes gene_type:complete
MPKAILAAIVSSAKKICCGTYPIERCQDLRLSFLIIVPSISKDPL